MAVCNDMCENNTIHKCKSTTFELHKTEGTQTWSFLWGRRDGEIHENSKLTNSSLPKFRRIWEQKMQKISQMILWTSLSFSPSLFLHDHTLLKKNLCINHFCIIYNSKWSSEVIVLKFCHTSFLSIRMLHICTPGIWELNFVYADTPVHAKTR